MKKSYSPREIGLGIILMFLGLCSVLSGFKVGWFVIIGGFCLFLTGIFMKPLLKWELKKRTGANQIAEDNNGCFVLVHDFDHEYRSPEGFHRHKCDYCNYIWEHSNKCGGIAKHHECPKCGMGQWSHYRGAEPPTKM